MEELKKLLGEELFAQVTAKLGDKKLVFDEGNLIPKYRLDEVIEQKKALEGQVTQYDKDLKELKGAAKGNEDLTAKIAELQESSKAAKLEGEKREISLKKSFAIKESLLDAGVSDPAARDILAKNFDVETIELYEQGESKGKVKGFDELIKPYKENKAFSAMFGEEKKVGGQGKQQIGKSNGDFFTREQVNRMSQEEVTANIDKINKSMETWTN